MMRKLLKICFAFSLSLFMVMPALSVIAEAPSARVLSVFRVDGYNAYLMQELDGRHITPRQGQRLGLGNVMRTGLDTQVYMQLDRASIVKQDEESTVEVSVMGNRLVLSVLEGSILVDVEELEQGHSLETRIGGTVMSVRGTLFIAAERDDGTTVITMLSGDGAVFVPNLDVAVLIWDEEHLFNLIDAGFFSEEPLQAGYAFWLGHDDEDEFEVRPIDLQEMSLFELQEVYNYSEYLLEVGTLTPEMLVQLPPLISLRQIERSIRLEARFSSAPCAMNRIVAGGESSIFIDDNGTMWGWGNVVQTGTPVGSPN